MAAEKTRDNIGSPTSDGSQQIKVLDEAFKSYIDDMKPFVLSLSQKRGNSFVKPRLLMAISTIQRDRIGRITKHRKFYYLRKYKRSASYPLCEISNTLNSYKI